MVDHDLILAKAASIKTHVDRIIQKGEVDLQTFLSNPDRQDIVLFNLQMSIQNCIDIAAHIISEEGFGVPGSNNEMFYLLEDNGYLNTEITEKMVKAVGLRNLIVHEYARIELRHVHSVAQNDVLDLYQYLKAIFSRLGMADSFPSVPIVDSDIGD